MIIYIFNLRTLSNIAFLLMQMAQNTLHCILILAKQFSFFHTLHHHSITNHNKLTLILFQILSKKNSTIGNQRTSDRCNNNQRKSKATQRISVDTPTQRTHSTLQTVQLQNHQGVEQGSQRNYYTQA